PAGAAGRADSSNVPVAAWVCSRFSYGWRATPVGARVGAQSAQHPPVVPDRILALRRLDNLNHCREARIAHDPPERLGSDLPFADPLVSVQARAPRALGVVQVQALEQRETDGAVELIPHRVDRAGHVIPRSMEMGRVKCLHLNDSDRKST